MKRFYWNLGKYRVFQMIIMFLSWFLLHDSFMVLWELRDVIVVLMILSQFPISLWFLHGSHHFNYGWCSWQMAQGYSKTSICLRQCWKILAMTLKSINRAYGNWVLVEKVGNLHTESIKQYEYMIEVLKKDYKEISQELDKIDRF